MFNFLHFSYNYRRWWNKILQLGYRQIIKYPSLVWGRRSIYFTRPLKKSAQSITNLENLIKVKPKTWIVMKVIRRKSFLITTHLCDTENFAPIFTFVVSPEFPYFRLTLGVPGFQYTDFILDEQFTTNFCQQLSTSFLQKPVNFETFL